MVDTREESEVTEFYRVRDEHRLLRALVRAAGLPEGTFSVRTTAPLWGRRKALLAAPGPVLLTAHDLNIREPSLRTSDGEVLSFAQAVSMLKAELEPL